MNKSQVYQTDLKEGSKVELGFIPEKVVVTDPVTGVAFVSYPEFPNNAPGTIQIAADGTRTILAIDAGIKPFEGEFIPPASEGEANVRKSKGIELGSAFGATGKGYIIEAEFTSMR